MDSREVGSASCNTYPLLVGDLGGTNVRFGIVSAEGAAPREQQAVPTADYPGLEEAITAYLEKVAVRPVAAAIAVASPVAGDTVTLTNLSWQFSIARLRERLSLQRLLIVNDFTALAMALPTLRGDELRKLGGGTAVAGAPKGLLGPGTGLGVSGLVAAGSGWIPLQSEGGHVTLPPVDKRQMAIIESLWQEHPHLSAERLLSGAGLQNLYRAIGGLSDKAPLPTPSPREISERGLASSDPLCREVLDTFCSLLGTVAGNLALTLGAQGGVYIGGGIVPKLGDYFFTSPFRSAFEWRGRFSDYLARVPVYVIEAEVPALQGAAAAFASTETGLGSESRVANN